MAAVPPLIRAYRDGDLGRVVELWERAGLIPVGPDGLGVDEAADLLTAKHTAAFVADSDGEIVAVALGGVLGAVGFVFRVVGDESVLERLLDKLEGGLVERGARRLVAALRKSHPLRDRLATRGFRHAADSVVLERDMPATATGPGAVSQLGGQLIDRDLWDRLEGMAEAKGLIERRVIWPLAQPDLAARHGVVPPKGVVLFGPPGTGKTTFAKGVASCLEWPFIPIEASQLVEEGPEKEARLLAETFERVRELPSAVVFFDEVEDIASDRQDERKVTPRVTTEFLRQVPTLRDAAHHLLVCATNWVSRLDPAFLRPGRFDYVLPVGPPDAEARRAIWRRYVREITDQDIDFDALVDASERFTPADIEFAARKAAQLAFEREYTGTARGRASTADMLDAIRQTRPTLTAEMIETFDRDRERFARY